MKLPFYLPPGHVLKHDGTHIRFRGLADEETLDLWTLGEKPRRYKVKNPQTGRYEPLTVELAIREFAAGRLVDPQYNPSVWAGREKYLHLDRSACLLKDPKVGWRFDWAWAARSAKLKRSLVHAETFIKHTSLGVIDDISDSKKPSARTLLRWMQQLDECGWRIGGLLNISGRPTGHSQLTDLEDRLVHKWAQAYWNPEPHSIRLEHKLDAAAMVQVEWDELKARGIQFLGESAPSAECVRQRINSLEGYETYAARNGRIAADKYFKGNGEPVAVERPFERIYLDGVEWEHLVYFSEEFKAVAPKLRSVIAMDVCSSFVFPFPTFADDFRSVYGMAALRNVLAPPITSRARSDVDPEEALCFGAPGDVVYDRDRTLISPRMVPNLLNITSTVELAQAYHSDAKAKLENWHGVAKRLIGWRVKGRILPAVQKAHALAYNPIKEVNVTRSQYIDLLEQVRQAWNNKPKKSLGNLSPKQVMMNFLATAGPRLLSPDEVWRGFASTPSKRQILTTDGLTYDNVHYRWNREGITEALSSNHRRVPFKERLESTAKIEVSIRVWEDDLDYIEVYDEINKKYHGMWSTEPEYTGGLNRWEHHFYRKALRNGLNGATTKVNMLRQRAATISNMHNVIEKLPLRERPKPLGLMESEARRSSKASAKNVDSGDIPELHTKINPGGIDRLDVPKPPFQGAAEEDPALPEGGADVRSNPHQSLMKDLGLDLGGIEPGGDRWNFENLPDDEEEED